MDSEPPKKRPRKTSKPKGFPVWVALTTVLIFALVGAGGFGSWFYFTKSSKARAARNAEALEIQKQQAEIDRQKGEEDVRRALARNRQQEMLAQARKATNSLERLRVEARRLMTEANALKSNDAGRKVAIHPELISQARRFYETDLRELPSDQDIVVKIENARRLEQQIVDAEGTAFEPATNLVATAQSAGFWAESNLQRFAKVQTLLSSLVQESKIKVADKPVGPNSATLEAAIAEQARLEILIREQAIRQQTADAEKVATKTLAAAEAEKIVKAAEAKAARIVQDANDAVAKQKREELLHGAETKVENTRAEVEAQKREDEATRIKLRKKASDPNIQAKLAPFTTPGYWQPSGITIDKAPHSFTQLKNSGALSPTIAGLQRLVFVGITVKDKVRPRWPYYGDWRNKPDQLETIKEVQQLLIELGPVLVEMKQLNP